jgi:sarcosine oxidase subunit alpha
MTASRLVPVRKRVTITLDGDRIEADEGEPVASALVAADRLVLARSPKLHRPRGPSCLRGGCDGCLSRVDGVPNVMTCLVPAREGMRIETQNVIGTRNVDLLRVTDWFFPNGIDHHHFLAGVPGAGTVMQAIARRVAGLGHLPESTAPVPPGERRSIDALVVGGGAAGIAAASVLASKGASVVLADDGVRLGGSLRALGVDAVSRAKSAFPLDRVDVRSATVVAGIYERDALLVGPAGAAILTPRVFVLATGTHDGQAMFEGNDLPGVMSARAAATLAAEGIAVGARLVIAGDGAFAKAASRHLASRSEITRVRVDELLRTEGSTRLGGVVVRDGSGERRLRADALAIDMDGAPAFELASQLGARMTWSERGFTPVFDETGQCADGAYVAGELRGVPVDEERLLESGRMAGDAGLRSLLR